MVVFILMNIHAHGLIDRLSLSLSLSLSSSSSYLSSVLGGPLLSLSPSAPSPVSLANQKLTPDWLLPGEEVAGTA